VEASAISGWNVGGKNDESALEGTSAVFVSGLLHKSPRFAPEKSLVAWSIGMSIILVYLLIWASETIFRGRAASIPYIEFGVSFGKMMQIR